MSDQKESFPQSAADIEPEPQVQPISKVPRVSAGDRLSPVDGRYVADHELLARLMIREGKSFLSAAMEAGYSEATARKGLRQVMAESSVLSEAIRKEWQHLEHDVTRLKPMAVARLFREIADPDSPNAMKAVELAGRFRENDWFVRNSDNAVGVFVALAEPPPIHGLDAIEKYKD